MTRTPRNLSQLQQAVDRNTVLQAQRASFETTITPELADTLGKSYILGRYTNPEIIASAAVAGITDFEDLHKNVATQLLKQGIVPGREDKRISKDVSDYSDFVNAKDGQVITVLDPKTGKPIQVTVGGQRTKPTAAFTAPGQTPTGLRVRTPEEIAAEEKRKSELAGRVPVVDMRTTGGRMSLRGMEGASDLRKANLNPVSVVTSPFKFTGAALNFMAPDFLEPVAVAVRATTKTLSVISMSPQEFVSNFVNLTLRDAYAANMTEANPFERFQAALDPQKIFNNLNEASKNTSFVQAGVDILEGRLDTGEGFFYQGESGERLQAAKDEALGTVAEAAGIDTRKYYLTPGEEKVLDKPFQSGFLAGEMAVDAKLTSRDGELYDLIYDTANTAMTLLTDPGIIFGVDAAEYLVRGLAKSAKVNREVATAYVTAREAKNFVKAAEIAAKEKIDIAVADLLTNRERQVQAAKDITSQQETIVYSGDRSFDPSAQVTKFKDVDDPDFVPNPNNYLGEGLYVTDSVWPASSLGYNVGEEKGGLVSSVIGQKTITPFGYTGPKSPADILKESKLVPENIELERVGIAGEGVNAGVWKFDKTNLNFLDFNDYGLKARKPIRTMLDAAEKFLLENVNVADNYDVNLTEEYFDSKKIFDDQTIENETFDSLRQKTIEQLDEGPIDIYDKDINDYITFNKAEDYINWLKSKPNYRKHLDRTSELRNLLETKYGFDEEFASIFSYKLTHMVFLKSGLFDSEVRNLQSVISRTKNYMKFSNKLAGGTPKTRIGYTFQNLSKGAEEILKRNQEPKFINFGQDSVQQIKNVQLPVGNDRIDNLLNDFSNFMQNEDLEEEILRITLKTFYKDKEISSIIEEMKKYNLTKSQQKMVQTYLGPRPQLKPNPIPQSLISKGYDGMRYDGGQVMGGTGEHNAFVVWKPSKLQHLDIMSGSKFPINQIVDNLGEADKYRYRAEELQNLKDAENELKQSVGLISGDIKTLDLTRVNAMRYTKTGKSILQKIADEPDPVVIWRDYLKRKSPKAAMALSKAKTPDEVWEIINEAVYSADPGMNLRYLPKNGWQDWVSDTGYKVKQNVDKYSKQTAMMPDETYIPFDDAGLALERTDRVLQVAGVKGKERDVVLRSLFDTIELDTSKAWDDFFEIANETSLKQKMVDAGWTEDQIKMATSYRRKGDNVTRWTLEDLADDIPVEWFDEGDGPMRITQLLSGGGYLIDPEVLDTLIRDTGPFVSALNKLTGYDPKMLEVIGGTRKATKYIEKEILGAFVKPAALGAPLPVRYIMRVVPEEMLRVAFSGEFDNLGQYMSQIFSGHLNYDTFGRTIADATSSADEMAKLQHLRDEYSMLSQQLSTAPSMASKTQKRINAIEKKYGTQAELQAKIDGLAANIANNIPSEQRALSNKVRGHLESTYDPNVLDEYLQRSKVQMITTNQVLDPSKITSKERLLRINWVQAQATDMAEMSVNPDYAAVANAMLTGDATAMEQIAQEFLSAGKLGQVYAKYTKNVWGVKKGWDWNTIEAARSRVTEIARDIKQRSALQPEILEAISTGKHNGVNLSETVMDNVYKPSKEFKKLVRETLLDNADAPKQVPYFPLVKSNPKAVRNNNFMYKSFSLYSKTSAVMTRNPLWAQAYWKRVQEMLPAMDTAEATKLIADNTGKLPDYLINSLNDSLPEAKGLLNRDEVSRLAEAHAKEVVDKLLYNAQNNKSYFASRHQIMFMFFDAYREQWATWLKLMKQPKNLHKVDIAVRELQKFREPFAEGENTILHNDTNTGKQVITVPLSRWMLGITGGDSQFSIPTRNLSFVGSVAPGIGPVAQLFASSWKPDSEVWANAKSTFMPFSTGEVSVDARDYFIPQFASLLVSGVSGKGKEKLPQADALWGLIEKFSGPRVEEMKKASVIPIMRQLATKMDKYPMTPEGRQQLQEDADGLSNSMAIARGFARIFLPAAPITQFYVDTKQGGMLQGMLLDEIRTTENEVYARGGNLSEAVSILLDKWGTGIWAFFGSSSETNIPGLQPTKEYQKWVFSNKGLLDKYPVAGGYLGPQLGEYNAKVFMQQMQLDQRQTKGAPVSMEEAANLYADVYFDYQMSTIPEEWENSAEATQFRDKIRTETEQKFPTWSPKSGSADAEIKRRIQFHEINKMIADPKITSSPAGRGLKEYMDARNVAIPEMVKFASGDVTERNWSSVNASYSLRQYLYNLGNKIATDIPEFGPMWTNVLVKEFNKKDLKISTEVAQ